MNKNSREAGPKHFEKSVRVSARQIHQAHSQDNNTRTLTLTTNSTCCSTGRVAPGAAFAFAVAILPEVGVFDSSMSAEHSNSLETLSRNHLSDQKKKQVKEKQRSNTPKPKRPTPSAAVRGKGRQGEVVRRCCCLNLIHLPCDAWWGAN